MNTIEITDGTDVQYHGEHNSALLCDQRPGVHVLHAPDVPL